MKRITLLTTFACFLSLSQGYCEELINSEETLFDLEQELLSLEDELLHPEEIPSVSSLQTPLQESTENLQLPAEETSLIELEPATPEESPFEETLIVSEEPKLAILSEQVAPTPNPDLIEPILSTPIQISFKQVFDGSPWIYSLLFSMSFTALAVCLYAILRIKEQDKFFTRFSAQIKEKLLENNFSEAIILCQNNPGLLSRMVASGLSGKSHGLQAIIENMKAEGKRATISSWQRLNLLQDIAIMAPMVGLLGTVIGLFYAFYDLNRSFDSLTNLLDGLGISVGTTVAGIGVAILAMVLHSTAKFKLVRTLARVEAEATSLAHLIDTKN